jgi:hypothetical protein
MIAAARSLAAERSAISSPSAGPSPWSDTVVGARETVLDGNWTDGLTPAL